MNKTILFKLSKFNFVSKVYNKQNLKSQKIFKFTNDSEMKKEIQMREKYFNNLSTIKDLQEKIKIEDILTYTTEGSKDDKKLNIMMKRDTEEKEVKSDEIFKPVNLQHKNKKIELKEKIKNLKSENAKINSKFLQNILEDNINKNIKSIKTDYNNYDDVIRANIVKDIFSHGYSFNNRFLNPLTYESVNKIEDDKSFKTLQEENEINMRQKNLESEISDVLDDIIKKEMSNFDVEKTMINHKLAQRPLKRTIPVDLNQSPILLLEGDLNVNYETHLEYERLINLTNTHDDFGKKIKEELEKEEEKEENQDEDDKEVMNDNASPTYYTADLSFTKI